MLKLAVYPCLAFPHRKMTRPRFLFLSFYMLACFYVFAYPVARLASWAGVEFVTALATGLLLWVAGFFAMRYAFAGPNMKVRYVVVHWMGMSFILASVVLGYELARLPLEFDDGAAVPWLIAIAAALVLFAIGASHHLRIRKLRIDSPKLREPRRVVQISDVHIGSRQRGFMARIVRRINALKPDFVVITGDLLDSTSVDIRALQPLEDIGAPVYFSVGNHERYADLGKAIEMVTRLGIKPLQQAVESIGSLQFIGIDDAESRTQVAKHLPALSPSREHFTILLYHRPLGFEAAAEHGIDLMLSGHTHRGQVFPFNLVVRQQFRRVAGLYRIADNYHYVSPGTGTWGPLMRLGSFNEISCFDLVPLVSKQDPAISKP